MEHDIAFLAKVIGDGSISDRFLKASKARHKAIKSVFWNAKKGQWLDYWLNDITCISVCELRTLQFSDSYGSDCPNLFLCNMCRNLRHGKLVTKIRMYLLQTSSLCGLSHYTQVCTSEFSSCHTYHSDLTSEVGSNILIMY